MSSGDGASYSGIRVIHYRKAMPSNVNGSHIATGV